MTSFIHLSPEPIRTGAGGVRRACTVEIPGRERKTLWFDVDEAHAPWIDSASDDAFVLACIFAAMKARCGLSIHGCVSPSLLRNLTELMRVFASWRPASYVEIDLRADEEREPNRAASPRDGAITGFSGGLDSTFTLFRHAMKLAGRWSRPLVGAVVVHGFDIPLDEASAFSRVVARCRETVTRADPGLETIVVRTNAQAFVPDWLDACGAALVAVLSLFATHAREVLVAGETTYGHLVLPDGINPISDHLLGSDTFPVTHDGASFERPDKLRFLSSVPGALAGLRVCWEGKERDRNCGRCEKCIRTILAARVAGLPLPACFEEDATTADICRVLDRLIQRHPLELADLRRIFALARAAGITDEWVAIIDRPAYLRRR